MASTKVKVLKKPKFSKERVGKVKEIIQGHVNSYFAGTLGAEKDIVNIYAALIFYESTFNAGAVGPRVEPRKGNETYNYLQSSPVQAILKAPNVTADDVVKKRNIEQGFQAMGLGQVMGHYFVKGASPSGRTELERLRPDLASNIVVEPGSDIISQVLGEENMSTQILAGLVILEGKYRNTRLNSEDGYFHVGSNKRQFPTRIAGAVAAYLGLGSSDVNGTTPESYSSSIVGGTAYKTANFGGGSVLYDVTYRRSPQVAQGPETNGRHRPGIKIPGCA